MYRECMNDLAKWMQKKDRKPLVICGAKGVGKTWLVEDFADGFFENKVSIDFKTQEYGRMLFNGEMDKNQIVKMLEVFSGEQINPKSTLLILENIHSISKPGVILSFISRYLTEFYVTATSAKGESVIFRDYDWEEELEILHLYPLSFSEFLIENKEAVLCERIEKYREEPLREELVTHLEEYLEIYYLVGGMPEAVKCWIDTMDFQKVNQVKAKIFQSYSKAIGEIENDSLRNRVLQVWDSIPNQLNKENKKFQYQTVKLTARSREYYEAVDWLVKSGFIYKVNRIKEGEAPLFGQEDIKSFEVFMVDVGMLSYLYEIEYQDLRRGANVFTSHNQSLTEQFVFQELLFNQNVGKVYYWTSDATARIEFIFEDSGVVIPIEINLYGNNKAQSLKVYKGRYKTPMALRITCGRAVSEDGIYDMPLYAIWNL